jgi:hypothetical protein
VPARPTLVINRLRQPVNQVLNDERQADLSIELVPADDFGELVPAIPDTEVALREGLIRRIQRSSQAADARTWAFKRAVQAGRGYYLIMTAYVPGKTWDQDITVVRVYNQASVTLDPAHEQPDGSDAAWGFWGTDLPWDEYKAEYPRRAGTKNAVLDLTREEFRALGDERPGWFTADGPADTDTRMVRVVNYFYTERAARTLCQMPDGSAAWEDELGPDEDEPIDRRDVIEKTIKWAKLDGSDEPPLDETDWPGPDLPIIKVLGEELQPYDNDRRSEGMVRPARDACQGFNAMTSKWVETIGLAPIPPLQMPEENIGPYGAWYQLANTRTLPFLPYITYDASGRQIAVPSRTPVDTPIAAIAGSVQMFDQAIQSTTVHDPSLGKAAPALKSGKAIQSIVAQDQQGTSNYLDNLTRSIRYEAQIINNLLYPIYNRPGRLARIVNGQGEAQTVLLHQPSVQQNGRPQLAPVDPITQQPPPHAKTYTLTKDAHFNVAVKIAKNYDTRRQEEAALFGQIIQADPPLMGVFGDLFFKSQDGPGMQEAADRAKAMLVPPIQALLQSEASGGGAPNPLQAQLTAAQQQIAQLQQQLKTAPGQAAVQAAHITAQNALKLAIMNNAAKIAVAKITAAGAGVLEANEDLDEAMALNQQQAHELNLAATQNAHEAAMSAQEHQQGLAAGQQQAQITAQQAAQAHQQQLEQGAAAAQQQAPPPGGPP